MTTPLLESLQELYVKIGWTDEAPRSQGWYWHWNGDHDCGPVPVSVLYSGTTGNCFVSMGQLGIERAIDCNQYGGWWMPIYDPKVPTEQQEEKEIEQSMQRSIP